MEERERTAIPWDGALQSFELDVVRFPTLAQKVEESSQFKQAVMQCEQRIQAKKKIKCLK